MGNFEAELFTVVDSILELLGERPKVIRGQAVDDKAEDTTSRDDCG